MAYKQHQVFAYFFSSFKKHLSDFLDNNDISVMLLEEADEKSDLRCLVSFIGYEEIKQHNAMAKIQIKKINDQGDEVEYLVKPPFTFRLKIAAIIDGKNIENRLTCLGELLGYLKENNQLDPGDYDWYGNNGDPVPIEIYSLKNGDSKLLPEKYQHLSPYTILFTIVVGIQSADPSGFTRVKERKFTALNKKQE